MGKPIAWLRDVQPDAEDEALAVCIEGDPGSFPVYADPAELIAALVEAQMAISYAMRGTSNAEESDRYAATIGRITRAIDARKLSRMGRAA